MSKETHEDYAKGMLTDCRQFSFFGIQPIWRPGEKDIEGFCHDEVVRQFHDTRDWNDGGKRVEQMLDAWHYAEGRSRHAPSDVDVLKLGALIEPDYNRDGFRHENVYIGDRMGVYPPYISECVTLLTARAHDVVPGEARPFARGKNLADVLQIEDFKQQVQELVNTVDEWYLAFEYIHPFRDGNGRSGKILHNWLNGTLDDPVLVADYFQGGNP